METNEKICRRCYKGRLDLMTTEEKMKAGLDVNKNFLGCDECQHYEEYD
jgi:hypothetical protein